MRLKMYCTSCGHANSYASTKPNFCQKCGTAFAHSQQEHPAPPPQQEQSSEQHGEQAFADTELKGLDIEISDCQLTHGPTLDDLIGQPQKKWTNKDLGIKGKRGRPKKFNKEQVQKDFGKEAGSLKNNKPK